MHPRRSPEWIGRAHLVDEHPNVRVRAGVARTGVRGALRLPASEPLPMPAHDSVRLHDGQGRAPVPPGVGEQPPKESISLGGVGDAAVPAGLKLVQNGGGRLAHVSAENGSAEGVSRPAQPPRRARFSLDAPEHSRTLYGVGQRTSVGPPKWTNSKPAPTLLDRTADAHDVLNSHRHWRSIGDRLGRNG